MAEIATVEDGRDASFPVIRTASFHQTTVENNLDTYSDTLLALVANYRNGGAPEGCNCQSMVGKSKRGEVALRLFALVDAEQQRVVRAGFKTRGCLAVTGCASALCSIIEGRSYDEVLALRASDIENAVDGLPSDKAYTAHFAVEAARGLVGQALANDGFGPDAIFDRTRCDPFSVSCLMCEHCSLRETLQEMRIGEIAEGAAEQETPSSTPSGEDIRQAEMRMAASFVRQSSRNGILASSALLEESLGISDEVCFEFYDAASGAFEGFSDINIIESGTEVYFYSSDFMADAYARWCFLAIQNDDVTTLCTCIRDESRIYPRPLFARSLTNDPFAMTMERIESAWEIAKKSGVGEDLERTNASNGDLYFFSTKFMSRARAAALAEWRSVERFLNT